ncbi:hypothetical protein Sulfitobl28_16290 [Sulfitobacter pontiacus]|nr:hypothetical protein Sulfitobl28_16290 [Sulfitobacter pontiacus]
MSYGMGFALQQAIFGVLSTDQEITALVGDAVFDAAPAGRCRRCMCSWGPKRCAMPLTGRAAGRSIGSRFLSSRIMRGSPPRNRWPLR